MTAYFLNHHPIFLAFFRKRLKESILTPDVGIIKETDNSIFLKDLNKGSISITNSAEMIYQIYARHERIFYLDTENQ